MRKNILRKSLILSISVFFIALSFLISVSADHMYKKIENKNMVILDDQIDQSQTLWDGAGISNHNPNLIAQSFKPSLNTLTRIQIIACRDGNPTGNIYGSIRSELDGEDIISASINAEDLLPDSN
jgi:hypothetical protein